MEINRLKLIKEIRSKKGVLHFRRWQLLKTPWFSIYIHGIYKEDQDLHLHNHPWNIFTILLKGWYVEKLERLERIRHPLHFSFLTTKRFHKIKEILEGPVYTLAIVGRRINPKWGFSVNSQIIDTKEYRHLKNEGKLHEW